MSVLVALHLKETNESLIVAGLNLGHDFETCSLPSRSPVSGSRFCFICIGRCLPNKTDTSTRNMCVDDTIIAFPMPIQRAIGPELAELVDCWAVIQSELMLGYGGRVIGAGQGGEEKES
jgi:hypothetical protein